jgi:hypothetical protein
VRFPWNGVDRDFDLSQLILLRLGSSSAFRTVFVRLDSLIRADV